MKGFQREIGIIGQGRPQDPGDGPVRITDQHRRDRPVSVVLQRRPPAPCPAHSPPDAVLPGFHLLDPPHGRGGLATRGRQISAVILVQHDLSTAQGSRHHLFKGDSPQRLMPTHRRERPGREKMYPVRGSGAARKRQLRHLAHEGRMTGRDTPLQGSAPYPETPVSGPKDDRRHNRPHSAATILVAPITHNRA